MAARTRKRTTAKPRRPASAPLDAGWRKFIGAAADPETAAWPDPTGAPSLKRTIRAASRKKAVTKKLKKAVKKTGARPVSGRKRARKKPSRKRAKAR